RLTGDASVSQHRDAVAELEHLVELVRDEDDAGAGVGHLPQEEEAAQSIADVRTFMTKVEWDALDEEEIAPAGDPRLTENRPQGQGGN
ncbi:MAG: hypothetical protein AAGA69_09945, partial [Pseudomonadota bacterium]